MCFFHILWLGLAPFVRSKTAMDQALFFSCSKPSLAYCLNIGFPNSSELVISDAFFVFLKRPNACEVRPCFFG